MDRKSPELKIEEVMTSKLLPYANNAKIHTRDQINQIAESISQLGFNDPVAIWTNSDGNIEIVEGHGRVMAAKKLGIDSLPVVYLDHLSDDQRRAYTHIHNQLTLNTSFDMDILNQEIASIGFNFEPFGIEIEQPTFEVAESKASETRGKTEKDGIVTCPRCGHKANIEEFAEE